MLNVLENKDFGNDTGLKSFDQSHRDCSRAWAGGGENKDRKEPDISGVVITMFPMV